MENFDLLDIDFDKLSENLTDNEENFKKSTEEELQISDEYDIIPKTGFLFSTVGVFLKNSKVEGDEIYLFNSPVLGLELVGYLKVVKEKLILSSQFKKAIKNKKDKEEIEEHKINDEIVDNNNYVEVIVYDDYLHNQLKKLISNDNKMLVSIVGTITTMQNSYGIKVNGFKQIHALNDNFEEIQQWIKLNVMFTRLWCENLDYQLPEPFWGKKEQKSNTINSNLEFHEWIQSNKIWSRYAVFLGKIGVKTWHNFHQKVCNGIKKYQDFTILLKQYIRKDEDIAKFIENAMDAYQKFT